jgi:DNA-binding beta-propeller fold protein YncE
VYVCDSGGRRGAIFDLVKPEFRTFGDKAPYRLGLPINISVGPQGEKYVTDTMHGQVLILDPDDKPVRAISKPAGLKPCDAVWHDGELFVADLKSNSILVMDPASGKLLRQFGKSGSGPGEFFQPTNLAFGPDGALYVSDTLNARIQKLDREGHVLKIIGKRGMTLGDMVRPRGIAVDREGRLYVADAATDSVQVYDTEGRLLVMLGGPGSDPGCLALPAGVALSYEGIEPFAKYCALDFRIEYLILVSSQLGPNKVSVYGFGTYTGALAAAEDAPDVRRAPPPTGDKQESPKPQAPSPKEDPSPKTP